MKQCYGTVVFFPILCGVRQGGVDDLINELRCSGYSVHIGSVFVGSLFYADDIVLLSPSCYGLQRLLSICKPFANTWNIKFNPARSQVITFSGKNPQATILHQNGA